MEKLSREEMKSIKGSEDGPVSCTAKCIDGTTVSCKGATCDAFDAAGGLNGYCEVNGITTYCQPD
jgi:hypothetical protein